VNWYVRFQVDLKTFFYLLFGLLGGGILSLVLGSFATSSGIPVDARLVLRMINGLVLERSDFWHATRAASAGAMAEAAELDAHGLEAIEAHLAARGRALY